MKKKTIFRQWLQITAGLLVFSLGVHLTIYANIGLSPWDCMSMGLSYHTPLNYGLSVTVISVIVLIIDLVMHERIGWGTVIDALLTGNFIQVFNDLNPLPENHSVWIGIGCMLIGFVIMAIGMWIYMLGAQGCGPRDALLVGLGKRLHRLPIGLVEILLWSVVTIAGWLMGGPVGIGTLLSTFGAGAVMQLVYSTVHFEPRDVKHRDIIETTRELLAS